MDGRNSIAFCVVATLAVFIIHHLDVAKGNIRCRNIKCTLQLRTDGLKAAYGNTVLWVKSLQYATCQQVLLKGTDPHVRIVTLEGIAELADTSGGVKHRLHLHTSILHHFDDSVDDGLWGVKSGIYGALDAIRQLLCLFFVLGTFTDYVKQFLCLVEKLLIGLLPVLLVTITVRRVQDELQTAEAAIPAQLFTVCL